MHVFRRLTKMVTDFGAVYVTWEDSGAMRLENTSYRMQAEQGVQCQNESRETMPVPSREESKWIKTSAWQRAPAIPQTREKDGNDVEMSDASGFKCPQQAAMMKRCGR